MSELSLALSAYIPGLKIPDACYRAVFVTQPGPGAADFDSGARSAAFGRTPDVLPSSSCDPERSSPTGQYFRLPLGIPVSPAAGSVQAHKVAYIYVCDKIERLWRSVLTFG
jgi:hypothetical protein